MLSFHLFRWSLQNHKGNAGSTMSKSMHHCEHQKGNNCFTDNFVCVFLFVCLFALFFFCLWDICLSHHSWRKASCLWIFWGLPLQEESKFQQAAQAKSGLCLHPLSYFVGGETDLTFCNTKHWRKGLALCCAQWVESHYMVGVGFGQGGGGVGWGEQLCRLIAWCYYRC